MGNVELGVVGEVGVSKVDGVIEDGLVTIGGGLAGNVGGPSLSNEPSSRLLR